MRKTVAIIQARLGSSRLPLKMLLSLHGKPIVEWVAERVNKASLIDEVIFAIPDTDENNLLEYVLTQAGMNVYRGSENDVLTRFYEAAKKTESSHVVRVCADNPLIDPEEIDNLIRFYSVENSDYAYNHIPKNNLYPDGLGAEIISFSLLEEMYIKAKTKQQREHCMNYILDNSHEFVIKTFNPNRASLQRPDLKFDIDTFADYNKLSMKEFNSDVTSEELVKIFSGENNEIIPTA